MAFRPTWDVSQILTVYARLYSHPMEDEDQASGVCSCSFPPHLTFVCHVSMMLSQLLFCWTLSGHASADLTLAIIEMMAPNMYMALRPI